MMAASSAYQGRRSGVASKGVIDMADRQSTDADIAKWRDVFGRSGADFITVDGWVGRPAREQVWRAVEDGFLVEDERTSALNSDEQYTAVCFRPTDKLRAIIASSTSDHQSDRRRG